MLFTLDNKEEQDANMFTAHYRTCGFSEEILNFKSIMLDCQFLWLKDSHSHLFSDDC